MMMSFFLTLSILILQAASTRAGVDGDGGDDDDEFLFDSLYSHIAGCWYQGWS